MSKVVLRPGWLARDVDRAVARIEQGNTPIAESELEQVRRMRARLTEIVAAQAKRIADLEAKVVAADRLADQAWFAADVLDRCDPPATNTAHALRQQEAAYRSIPALSSPEPRRRESDEADTRTA